jgi:hypothetical protein
MDLIEQDIDSALRNAYWFRFMTIYKLTDDRACAWAMAVAGQQHLLEV